MELRGEKEERFGRGKTKVLSPSTLQEEIERQSQKIEVLGDSRRSSVRRHDTGA